MKPKLKFVTVKNYENLEQEAGSRVMTCSVELYSYGSVIGISGQSFSNRNHNIYVCAKDVEALINNHKGNKK